MFVNNFISLFQVQFKLHTVNTVWTWLGHLQLSSAVRFTCTTSTDSHKPCDTGAPCWTHHRPKVKAKEHGFGSNNQAKIITEKEIPKSAFIAHDEMLEEWRDWSRNISIICGQEAGSGDTTSFRVFLESRSKPLGHSLSAL